MPLALTGCGFEAPQPSRTLAPPTPTPPLSTLAATLTIPQEQIARLVNNVTEYRIADLRDQQINCGIGRCRLNMTATRTGPASVSAEDGRLAIVLPFDVRAEMQSSGFLSFLRAQGDGQGTATAETSLSVTPDWRLSSSTSGRVDLANGHLRIGPVVTNIAQLWDANQAALSRPLWHSLDAQMSRLDLRGHVAQLWMRAFTPLRVGKSPLSWLVLKPEQLGVAEPVIRDGAVTFALSLSARGHVVVQDRPPANPVTALPRAVALAAPSDEFSFAVPLLLPYGRAGDLAMASLAKKPPRVAGMNLTFSKIEILPSGQDVIVGAKFCADPGWDVLGWFASCGTVYLRGAPSFDPARGTIRVANLHYDMASANLMLSALHALAGDRLVAVLAPRLVFDESREIARLENEITAALAKPEGRDLVFSAEVQSFGAPRFSWTADGFLAFFSAKGRVKTALAL